MGRKSNKKKLKRNVETKKPSVSETSQRRKKQSKTVKESSKQHWFFAIGFFVLAILLYANTFQHRFVLDDHGIIANNKITKAAFSWENTVHIFNSSLRNGDVSDKENSLYRPFTKLILNAQWNLFGGNPHSFHVMSVLIYGLLCFLIFIVLYDFFHKNWVLPLLITLLFTVHPIHTEVVANVKSLDEILAMLGIMAALRCIQLYLTKEKKLYILWASLVFAIGLYSKESAVVAMGIFPLFVYYVSPKLDWNKILLSCAPLLAVALLFIVSRWIVLGQYPPNAEVSVMDNLIVMVKGNILSRLATAIMIVGYYIYTFFVPHPLACDYSYATLKPVGVDHWGFMLSFIVLIVALIYAFKYLKTKSKISFGILWFFITFSLASNIFFLIGTSFGERLFFLPSLGMCIITICVLAYFFNKKQADSFAERLKVSPVFWTLFILISLVYSYKTIDRNLDWKSDYELFSRDIKYNEQSTHLLYYMGNHLPSEDRKEVLTEYMSAAGFQPQQINDSIQREVAQSVEFFRRSMSIYPYLPADGYNQLGKAYFLQGELDSAYKYYNKAYTEDSTSGIYTNNMGTVYFQSGKLADALPYFKKAYQLDNSEADFMNNIGCVYGEAKIADSAIYWFKKASASDTLDAKSLQFLELTYRALGDNRNADYYKSRLLYVKQLRRERL